MKLLHTAALSAEQKESVRALVDACKEAEPVTLSAALEDGLDYFLSYGGEDDRTLLGYGFVFFPEAPEETRGEAESAEFLAFVHPKHRGEGHFTAMVNAALSLTESREEERGRGLDFCFLTDGKSRDALAVLEHIGAEYWYSEYRMVRPLTEADRRYRPGLLIQKDGRSPEGSDLYAAVLDGQVIGTCAVIEERGDACLYLFRIREAFRSRGYGGDFLRGLLALLAGRGIGSVSLQVSGLNCTARNLYRKTGFRVAETLSYYIY